MENDIWAIDTYVFTYVPKIQKRTMSQEFLAEASFIGFDNLKLHTYFSE
jgi:hypothetical protein